MIYIKCPAQGCTNRQRNRTSGRTPSLSPDFSSDSFAHDFSQPEASKGVLSWKPFRNGTLKSLTDIFLSEITHPISQVTLRRSG